ncbi:MAG: exodeoxyribonuclease VII small subunit [Alistipes sp.]|jgi:exodeoxyribonuclease VII small subunit|nr:exodeoxyribonuclease VII small subunit [Alistipes sp.]
MAKKATKRDIPYAEAIGQLEQILAKLRSGELSVNELADAVKRAKELIDICREQLTKTAADLKDIINQ